MLEFDIARQPGIDMAFGGTSIDGKSPHVDLYTIDGLEPGYYDVEIELDIETESKDGRSWKERILVLFSDTETVKLCLKEHSYVNCEKFMRGNGLIYLRESFGSSEKSLPMYQEYQVSGTLRVMDSPLRLSVKRLYRNRNAVLKVKEVRMRFVNHKDLAL